METFVNKYLTNVRALQIFQVLRYGVLIATGMLFAQAGLATHLIGLYEKLMLFSSVLTFFWVSGFIQGMLSSHGTIQPGIRSDKLFSVFIVVSFCSILSFIIFRIAAARFLNSDDAFVKSLTNLFSFYLLLAHPASLVEYIYLLLNKPKNMLAYGVVSFALQLWLVVGPVFFADDTYTQNDILYLSVCGVVASAGFRFLWLLVLLLRNAELKIHHEYLQTLLVVASPLIISAVFSGSINHINELIVTCYFDDATLAIFRNGARELPLALLLANSFSNAMLPKFSESQTLDKPLAEIKASSLRLMHFLFPVSIILMLVSKSLYPVLFNASFAASAGIFNIYLLLVISRLVFPQTILIGTGQTGIVMGISLAEAFINIICSIALINFWGIGGGAWGVIIACTAEKILLALYVNHKLHIPFKSYAAAGWLAAYSTVLVAVYIYVKFLS